MNKKRGITTILVTLILAVAFSSCDFLPEYIGDPVRPVRLKDIPDTCSLMYAASFLALGLFILIWIIV